MPILKPTTRLIKNDANWADVGDGGLWESDSQNWESGTLDWKWGGGETVLNLDKPKSGLQIQKNKPKITL